MSTQLTRFPEFDKTMDYPYGNGKDLIDITRAKDMIVGYKDNNHYFTDWISDRDKYPRDLYKPVLVYMKEMMMTYAIDQAKEDMEFIAPTAIEDWLEDYTMVLEFQPSKAARTSVKGPVVEMGGHNYRTSKQRKYMVGNGVEVDWNYADDNGKGAFFTFMKLKSQVYSMIVASVHDFFQTILTIPDTFITKMMDRRDIDINKIVARDSKIWNCLMDKKDGFDALYSAARNQLTDQGGQADTWMISEDAQRYLKHRTENRDYDKVGSDTTGFRNQYGNYGPVIKLEGNNQVMNVRAFGKIRTGDDENYNPFQLIHTRGEAYVLDSFKTEINFKNYDKVYNTIKVTDSRVGKLAELNFLSGMMNCHLYKNNGELASLNDLKTIWNTSYDL